MAGLIEMNDSLATRHKLLESTLAALSSIRKKEYIMVNTF
jgi:hypothetical protein